MDTIVASALSYHTHGLSVLALEPRGKKPLLSWQIFQTERADTALIRRWWSHQPQANVGIVTGALSGLIVLDIDGYAGRDALRSFLKDQAIREFPLTPTVKTGHGWHYYFAYPGVPMANATAWHGLDGVDIRGDGGYVVAPPSIHPNGRDYEWVAGRTWDAVALAPCPAWLRDDAQTPRSAGSDWTLLMNTPCREGSRNATLARLIGRWLGNPHLTPEGVHLAELAALGWGLARCDPPLSVGEIQTIFNSIAGREVRRRQS